MLTYTLQGQIQGLNPNAVKIMITALEEYMAGKE
jgi:hypothetical protein